ncbi:hypothetical protein [Staphylococcus auricularis]|uniref:Uncharacterized protein n=1 Tax=Staphylococcus auricularis TaxID=29379 RepID=A0ABX5IC03_9STAP|nr:hypothetical protein [Staphylococcus auricularis]MCE5038488.1 hypothetical protein [Staphylococcus auricularis]MEB6570270.1 hypothetical protein [Staphylococcus auricularis]PTH13036.1 hypothetical protein BU607_10100 [Staphylococcus auricularis]PTH25295.1 hypothetical protein BU608_08045 [Staphylococcus auricularis]
MSKTTMWSATIIIILLLDFIILGRSGISDTFLAIHNILSLLILVCLYFINGKDKDKDKEGKHKKTK